MLTAQCMVLFVRFSVVHCQVWEKYATAARFLLSEDASSKILCTTLVENHALLHRLLGVNPQRYLPSVPNLVYQYNVYTNYVSPRLELDNPELPSDV